MKYTKLIFIVSISKKDLVNAINNGKFVMVITKHVDGRNNYFGYTMFDTFIIKNNQLIGVSVNVKSRVIGMSRALAVFEETLDDFNIECDSVPQNYIVLGGK